MKYLPPIAVFLQAVSLFSQPVSRTVYGTYIPVPMTGSNITGVHRQVPVKVDREGNIYVAAGAKITGPEDDHVYLVKLTPDAKREIFTADLASPRLTPG